MLKRLLLLRHGKTSLAGRYVGSTDIGLSAIGVKQIGDVRNGLSHEGIDKILCSPMKRCRETLSILDLPEKVVFEHNLREVDFGEWEGMSFEEVVRINPDAVTVWAEGGQDFCFPGGECLYDFNKRLDGVKKDVLGHHEETLLIIAHGGVIRHLICSFLGLKASDYLLFNIVEGKYSILDVFDQKAVISGLNVSGKV